MHTTKKFTTAMVFVLMALLAGGCQNNPNQVNTADQAGVPHVNGPSSAPFVQGPTSNPPSYKAASESDTMEYTVTSSQVKR